MTYRTPQALRMALERRLLSRSTASGVGLDRLRRRVLFERIVARLESAEPGRWVLKGGMTLEVRLQDDARVTKDIDLGLRDDIADADELHDPATVAAATRQVFSERNAVEPPAVLPSLPESWPDRYERLIADHDLETQHFPAGVALVQRLWAEMFPMQET